MLKSKHLFFHELPEFVNNMCAGFHCGRRLFEPGKGDQLKSLNNLKDHYGKNNYKFTVLHTTHSRPMYRPQPEGIGFYRVN